MFSCGEVGADRARTQLRVTTIKSTELVGPLITKVPLPAISACYMFKSGRLFEMGYWGKNMAKSFKKATAAALCAITAAVSVGATPSLALDIKNSGNTETFGGVRQEAAQADCVAATECFIFFNSAATDIQITRVSCNWYFETGPNSGISLSGTELIRTSRDESRAFQGQHLDAPFYAGYGSTYTQYQFSTSVLWGIPQGWRPAVHVWWNVNTTGHFECTISGPAVS